ncbi:MAG TPA: serine/threonine-protein kinase [Polyangia bacterium]|jgi:serine/threonine protein kinase|nr:serine/threonine-protein kinase [Polyangia bacterium]
MNATSQQMAARRYRIERYLTEGGMGAIYVGKKLGPGGFEKDVVLKQLLPEHTSRPEFRDLFFREAKISATLDHANIVHTFDLVESDESLFIVMEYVRGADLRTICRRAKLRRRQLAPAAAIQIALEILAGLSYAHTRRDPHGNSLDIIHRDVSPSNILCSAEGEVKLSDFGIAKAATHSSVFYRVRGKVGYMSPEQARNQPIDARTDLYSGAVCLYEALTGERLFVGDLSTPPDVIYGQPIAPPSYKRPGLPRALDHVMATALASDPDDRYQDARAFAEALRQVAHHHGMLSSAPQLAEELREILGDDPNRWLQEDSESYPAPETQKIQTKALEGKEASSIGVVERSDLYLSGGDIIIGSKSPTVAGPPPLAGDDDLDLDVLLSLGPRSRKGPEAQTTSGERSDISEVSLPIAVDDDEDVPTLLSRPVDATPLPPSAPPPPRPSGSGRVVPPPIPRGARRSGSGRVVAPPPPPRLTPARPPSVVLGSPFEQEEDQTVEAEAADFPFTPAISVDELAESESPPRGLPLAASAHGRESPSGPASANREPHLPRPFAGSPQLPAPSHGAPHLPPPFAGAPQLPAPFAQDHGAHGAHGVGSGPHRAPGPALPPPANGFASTVHMTPQRPLLAPAPLLPPSRASAGPDRAGPHGLVVAAVLLAAVVGGAKLAALATRGDTARLVLTPEAEAARSPHAPSPAASPR